jgi:hypothetical protein
MLIESINDMHAVQEKILLIDKINAYSDKINKDNAYLLSGNEDFINLIN